MNIITLSQSKLFKFLVFAEESLKNVPPNLQGIRFEISQNNLTISATGKESKVVWKTVAPSCMDIDTTVPLDFLKLITPDRGEKNAKISLNLVNCRAWQLGKFNFSYIPLALDNAH